MTENNLKKISQLYPLLYTQKRLDEWRNLFHTEAKITKLEEGKDISFLSIDDAMPEQKEYAEENHLFLEIWENVRINQYANIATIKADYFLETDTEIRVGIDLLTLFYTKTDGWKIYNLVYEQYSLTQKINSII